MLRYLAILLLLLSAPFAGGVSAVAQARQSAMVSAHAHNHDMAFAGHDSSPDRGAHCERDGDCSHPASRDHPALCSACLAIGAPQIRLVHAERLSTRLAPGLQAALLAHVIEPQSPPPKEQRSI